MKSLRRAALPLATLAVIAAVLVYLVLNNNDHGKFLEEHGHGHAHVAPHGGALIVLGIHEAHVELVLDKATGQLDFYALDGHAEHILAMDAQALEIEVKLDGTEEWQRITLEPAEEGSKDRPTAARTLRLSATVESLQNQERFGVRLPELQILGRTYPGLTTTYPEGNE